MPETVVPVEPLRATPWDPVPDMVAVRRDGIVATPVDGQVVLYRASDRSMVALNPTAGALWELLDGCGTVRGLADLAAEASGADPTIVLEDVVAFVRELVRAGFVALDPAS